MCNIQFVGHANAEILAQWLEHSVYNGGVANFFESPHWHPHCTFSAGIGVPVSSRNNILSRIRSKSQMRNDKYIIMQYTNWINSAPSQY